MKPAERKRIARAIRALVPELHEKGRLLAATPRDRILRGIYLEDSSDSTRFYAWAFVQPLYAPSSTVTFNLGKRLGGSSRTWSVSELDRISAAVQNEGLPFFGPVSSPEALVNWSFLEGRSEPYALEARAYSLVASGRFDEGANALRKFADALTDGAPWVIDIRQRAERLANLAETDPREAHEILNKWEKETAAALRVEDLP